MGAIGIKIGFSKVAERNKFGKTLLMMLGGTITGIL